MTLKTAASLDGRIATPTGNSQWITGGPARTYAHRLRALHHAIVVGVETVVHDDPRLDGERLWGFPVMSVADAVDRRPDAVVLSSRAMNDTLARRAAPLIAAGATLIHAGTLAAEETVGA